MGYDFRSVVQLWWKISDNKPQFYFYSIDMKPLFQSTNILKNTLAKSNAEKNVVYGSIAQLCFNTVELIFFFMIQIFLHFFV